jgi:hypothetical protein
MEAFFSADLACGELLLSVVNTANNILSLQHPQLSQGHTNQPTQPTNHPTNQPTTPHNNSLLPTPPALANSHLIFAVVNQNNT